MVTVYVTKGIPYTRRMGGSGTETDEKDGIRRVGVLGGTFDPLHHAHLRLAEEAYENLNLDRVVLVLSALPPHKLGEEITPFETRWKMLEEVCRKNPRLSASDLESKREGPSYTVDTLETIYREYGPEVECFLLMGMDSAIEFPTWKSFQEILERTQLAVFARPGEDPEEIDKGIRDKMTLFDWEEFGISSTEIRQKVSSGKSIRYLVPPEVEKIVTEQKLYTSPDTPRIASEQETNQGKVVA